MSEKINGINWKKSSKAKDRRRSVITRLELQLASGEKPGIPDDGVFAIGSDGVFTPLSEHDINRINKEITTLKERI